jgi:glutamyl-tRNA synthetase
MRVYRDLCEEQLVSDSRPVRVRFAPSPTGDLHIGGVRTAQFNWMFARRHGGKFILRIEDTDQKRTQEQSLSGIMDGLRWAGLHWDEGPDIGGDYGPYIQSQRLAHYQYWANWLVEHGKAYRAYETPEELELISAARKANGLPPGYDRRARQLTPEDWARLDAEGKPYVIRLKVPLDEETVFEDMVRGTIRVRNDTLQDAVLLKADGFPTYHLAHMVDDHLMEISHVIRAEEWIPSTPLHVILYQAFGWEQPKFCHVPVILHPSGGKISKRKHPEASISYFIKGGYLPEAVTNFLCNVGWNYGKTDENGEEIQVFTKEEAAEVFDITRVTQTGTKFDVVKLKWLNGEWIRRLSDEELARRMQPFFEAAGLTAPYETLLKVAPLVKERMKVLTDAVEMAGFLFRDDVPVPEPSALIPKGLTAEQTCAALQLAHDALAALPDFEIATQEAALRDGAERLSIKTGQFFSPIRLAVTGQSVSPPLFEVMAIIGREKVLARLERAIAALQTTA